jgi:hypothetical protein
MNISRDAGGCGDRDSGVSAISGTLLMVALTVVLASIVFYFILSLSGPQNITKTSMKIMAFNSSTLGVTSMVGDSISIASINIIVGSETYNASGIKDDNDNGLWDQGETIFLYGLDLNRQTSVVVTTDTAVLLPGTVQWSNNPAPASPGGSGEHNFTSYLPGLRMITYGDPAFVNPVNASVADNITYACASSGYWSNDPGWPLSTAGKAHNFSVKFQGCLFVDANETYEIRIIASDSVYISVDGRRLVDVIGDHGAISWSTSTYLAAGYHDLEIGYVNYNSDAMIGEFAIQEPSEGIWEQPGLFYRESINA